MTDFSYHEFSQQLSRLKSTLPPVWLVYGEEMLCQEAIHQLVTHLLPNDPNRLSYEALSGDTHFMSVLEKVQTHSFFGTGKVAALLDARLFDTKKDFEKLIQRANSAYLKEKPDQAARLVARVLGVSNFTFSDVADAANRGKRLGPIAKENEDWLGEVIAHGIERGMEVPKEKSVDELLEKALENGFPPGNFLIIQCQSADRRRRLYKMIAEKGAVVDCSVPMGSRMADQKAQDEILRKQSREILSRHGKKIGGAALNALKEKTGFSLRTFSNRLKTLVAYVGERPEITPQDVAHVLKRTKDDPVYMLTDAMGLRQLKQSRFYLKTLLSQNVAPLQVLGALTNQIRKLIVARDFLDSAQGQAWRPGFSYNQFRQMVLPAIQVFDLELVEILQSWDKVEAEKSVKEAKKGRSKKGGKAKAPATDLYLAPNPQNSYPVYLLVKKAANFGSVELQRLLKAAHEADQRLKLGSRDPELVLGRILLLACMPS